MTHFVNHSATKSKSKYSILNIGSSLYMSDYDTGSVSTKDHSPATQVAARRCMSSVTVVWPGDRPVGHCAVARVTPVAARASLINLCPRKRLLSANNSTRQLNNTNIRVLTTITPTSDQSRDGRYYIQHRQYLCQCVWDR